MSSLEDSWVSNYYTEEKDGAKCDICYERYYGKWYKFELRKHLASYHKFEKDKAKSICKWLDDSFVENDVGAKYCRCNDCKNVIPNKPVYLMIHLKQVHGIEIPSDIKPRGLWNCTYKEWIWYYFYYTKDLFTEVESVKCNICDTCFPIAINTRNIINHINRMHTKFHPKPISMTDSLKKKFFFIEGNQMKCIYKCKYSSPICNHIDSNKELEHHLLNNHEINHAKTNDLHNWLILYHNVLSFKISKCTICENMLQQMFTLMKIRHFIKEHRIEFLFHLISKNLLDKLEILNSDNDTEDVALPGSSSQQPGQSINQSSSKITPSLPDISEIKSSDIDTEGVGRLLDKLEILNSDTGDVALPGSSSQQPGQSINQSSSKITPSLPDISEIKSSDYDTEGVGTSAISSYQQRSPRLHNLEIMLSDYSEIKSSDDDTEGIGTSTTSSYQQSTEELNNQEEISLSLNDYSNYDLITNSEYQISFIQEFGEAI